MDFDLILKFGELGVLLYVLVRMESAMGKMACALQQMTSVLMLVLRHIGYSDAEALEACVPDIDTCKQPAGIKAKSATR